MPHPSGGASLDQDVFNNQFGPFIAGRQSAAGAGFVVDHDRQAAALDHWRPQRHWTRRRRRLYQKGTKAVVAGRRDEAGKALAKLSFDR
jgi:hypothetical protein